MIYVFSNGKYDYLLDEKNVEIIRKEDRQRMGLFPGNVVESDDINDAHLNGGYNHLLGVPSFLHDGGIVIFERRGKIWQVRDAKYIGTLESKKDSTLESLAGG
jgi:hypothetical protein